MSERKAEFVWVQVAGAKPEPGEIVEIDGRKAVLTIGCADPFFLDDPAKLVEIHYATMYRPTDVTTMTEQREYAARRIAEGRHGWRGAR